MKVIYVGKELFLYLSLFFAFLSYAYRVYSAFQMGDLSFVNPLKHHIPEGMIFVGAPVTWLLALIGLIFFVLYGTLPDGWFQP